MDSNPRVLRTGCYIFKNFEQISKAFKRVLSRHGSNKAGKIIVNVVKNLPVLKNAKRRCNRTPQNLINNFQTRKKDKCVLLSRTMTSIHGCFQNTFGIVRRDSSKIFSHEFEMGIPLKLNRLNMTHHACSRIKLKILSPVNKLSDGSR